MISAQQIVVRLALAAVLGSIVGLERERLDRAAGLRTHALVAVGAALFMLVSAFGFADMLGVPQVGLGGGGAAGAIGDPAAPPPPRPTGSISPLPERLPPSWRQRRTACGVCPGSGRSRWSAVESARSPSAAVRARETAPRRSK